MAIGSIAVRDNRTDDTPVDAAELLKSILPAVRKPP